MPAGRAARWACRRRTAPRASRAEPVPPGRPGSPPAGMTGQPPGQRRPPGHGRRNRNPREMVFGPVRDLPGHRRVRAARLLPPPLLPRALRGTPLPLGRLPPGQVIRARRHRGVPAVPRPRPQRRRQLLPQISDQRLQRLDPLRLRRDQRITRIPWQRIGHSPPSFRKPRTATTTTRHQPPERNPTPPGLLIPGSTQRSRGREAATQASAMLIRNRPAASKLTRSAGR